MTALRPREDLPELRSGTTGQPAPAALITTEPLDVGRIFGTGSADAGRDAIVLGARAAALIRAGLAVRAFVLLSLAQMHLTRTIGGRVVTLEFGVYR